MKFKIFISVSLFFLFSCEKNEKNLSNEDILATDYFSTATNLKTLTNFNRMVVNDSLIKVNGNFHQYSVEGYINKIGQRINWWRIINIKENNEYNVRLEYRIVDNQEKINQFIFYNDKGEYKINSKFYYNQKASNQENIYQYNFFTPSRYNKKNLLKKFECYFFIDNKEIKHLDLDCKEDNTHFFVNITSPKSDKEIIVKGLFTELFEDNNKKIGQNEIYVLDTLNKPKKVTQTVKLVNPH